MSEIRNSDVPHLIEKQDNGQVPVQDDAVQNVHQLDTTSLSGSEQCSIGKAGTEIKGHLFEFKLLMLFMVRAITADYQFEFTCNNESIGGKFDDIVFRYEVPDDPPSKGKHWRYRYVQAKHKVDRTALSIKSSHLLSTSKKDDVTDYSLLKYFESYCKIKARGDDIQDCVICTTIDFDFKDMDGVILEPVDISNEEILKFQVKNRLSVEPIPSIYKLKLLNNEWTKTLLDKCQVKILARQLITCKKKNYEMNQKIFQTFGVALVAEKVIDLKKRNRGKFHKDFIDDLESLSSGAKDLRKVLKELKVEQDLADWEFKLSQYVRSPSDDKEPYTKLPDCSERCVISETSEFQNFCDKLVFVVNSPKEEEFDEIIQRELATYYVQKDSEIQFLRFSKNLLDWFSNIKKLEWLSSKVGKTFFLDGVTQKSTDYRVELLKGLGFHQETITNLARELNDLVNSPKPGKVIRISTQSPRLTAAKVISAIETWPNYETNRHDSYWVTSSNCLVIKDGKELWKNRLKTVKKSRHLLLVVDEDQTASVNDQNIVDLIPFNPAYKNKLIIISTGQRGDIKDEINLGDLNEETRTLILSKTISFQGSSATVGNLILCSETDKVIDDFSIQELMDENNKSISIPSFDTSDFEKSLYIKRQVLCPFQEQLMNELIKEIECTTDRWNGECTVDEKGKITWFTTDKKRKSKIWEKMQMALERNKSAGKQPQKIISENQLMNQMNIRVIITGVAGTGKSSVLSHYYEKLKSKKPDCWVIKISLMRYSQKFLKSAVVDPKSAIDFIVNLPAVGANQSPFAQSLLRHRLKTGDRIILMFDGFDEIDSECQDKVIKLINNLNENISIFVTTRPHMTDKLQLELNQLAYSLVNLKKEDQIKYMTSVWGKEDTNEIAIVNENELGKFATKLIDRVSETLNDEEGDFLGIPLQCRILAECFQSKIKAVFQECASIPISQSLSSLLEDSQHFDLASLYKLLIDTKRKEKFKFSTDNHLINYFTAISNKQLESHLTKLAIKTIIQNKEHADILWPVDSHYQSEKDCADNENNLDKLGVDLGLLLDSKKEGMTDLIKEDRTRFLHRTYAEYLVADYIFKGFQLNEEDHNKLLENKDVFQIVVWDILAGYSYDGVQVFLNSMFKKMVDHETRKNAKNFPKHLQEFSSFIVKINNDFLPYLIGNGDSFFLKRRKNTNIFKFIINCLEKTFTTSKVREVITRDIFKHRPSDTIFEFDNNLFQRLLSYYDKANDGEWNEVFINVCNIKKTADQRTERWDRELPQKNITIFLDYTQKHKKRLKTYRDEASKNAFSNMIKFLIECSNSSFKFYEILTSIYSNDSSYITTLIKDAVVELQNSLWSIKGKILQTLIFLQKLNNSSQQLSEISSLILRHDPETFQLFYKQYHQSAEIEFDVTSDSVIATDLFGMTRLHRAVLYDDIQTVQQILKNSPESLTLQNLNKGLQIKRSVLDLVSNENRRNHFDFITKFRAKFYNLKNNRIQLNTNEILENVSLTPLFVAFACCNEEICLMLLEFLKRTLPTDELRAICVSESGNINNFAKYAIRYRNESMLRTILKSVKTILGYEALDDLLKTSDLINFENFHSFTFKKQLFFSSLFKIIVQVFIQDNETQGYEKLNQFIFREIYFLGMAFEYGDPDILQKLIATKGFDNWTKSLLDKNVVLAFELFSSKRFLTGLEQIQRSQLVDIITKVNKETKPTSYWAKFIDGIPFFVINPIKWVLKIFREDENVLKHLLFHEDKNGTLIRRMLLPDNEVFPINSDRRSKNKIDVDKILSCLSPEMQEEFSQYCSKHAEQLIIENLEKLGKIDFYGRIDFLHFYLDNGSQDQLSKFVHVITTTRFLFGHDSRVIIDDSNEDFGLPGYMERLMTRMSIKLGENAVKDLILQNNGSGILTLRPVFNMYWPKIEEWFVHLSKEMRNEIRHHVLTTSKSVVNRWDYLVRYYLRIRRPDKINTHDVLDGFNLLVTFFFNELNAQQLQNFVDLITTVKNLNKTTQYSVWRDYIDQVCQSDKNQLLISEKSIKNLMKSIATNLGESASEKLTQHKIDPNFDDVIVLRTLLCGNIRIFEALISQFDDEKQQEIRRNSLCRLSLVEKVWNTNGPENLIRFYLLKNDDDPQEGKHTAKIVTGFNILIQYFLEELNQNQMNQWIQLILSVNTFDIPNNCSIWNYYIEKLFLDANSKLTQSDLNLIKKLLHCVEKLLGKEMVNKLLRHQNVNGVVIHQIAASETGRSTPIVDELLELLSNEDKLEILKDILTLFPNYWPDASI